MNPTSTLYLIYQVLQIAISPLVAIFIFYRCLKNRRYFRHLAERFGFLPSALDSRGLPSIWLHAVSVGEVLSAVPLVKKLRAERPHTPMFVSTTTLTGRAMAKDRLGPLVHGVFYAPLDYVSILRRVLRRIRPSVVVILETEIWPNLYQEVKQAGAALVIVNGRISDKTLPAYQQWSILFRYVLAQPDRILTQSQKDHEKYLLAGAPADRTVFAGNLKYDFHPPGEIPADLSRFIDQVWPEAVWIAASTMAPAQPGDPDEDDAVIAAFQELSRAHSRLLLILVPRKPERFDAAAEKLTRAGISFVRRSTLSSGDGHGVILPGVLLLDSIGELAPLYAAATVVFMGGTLASRGGHNILEAAYFGKPVIAGPHMENFAAVAEEFTAANALVRINEASQLAPAVDRLIRERESSGKVGAKARALADSKRGVVDRAAVEILKQSALAVPCPQRSLIAQLFLRPLSLIWLTGHKYNFARQLMAQRKLQTRVVSIGGLTMGGSGKSPLVAHLAQRVAEHGGTAGILTRGYRRKATEPMVIVPRGGTCSIDLTGDEAQVFIRRGNAHVGIGSSRYLAGLKMERELHPSVFILDDGFQHPRLARNRDVVLIDALDPLAGGLFPLGRRRESLESLERASAVIITRTQPDVPVTGIERLIERHKPGMPVFRSRIVPQAWVDLEWGTEKPVDEAGLTKVAAFCGLGAPASFWQTLENLGLEIVFRWSFGDHHKYNLAELERLASQAADCGADVLVTTEKDLMNLPEGAAQLIHPLRICWLRVGLEIENESTLLNMLL